MILSLPIPTEHDYNNHNYMKSICTIIASKTDTKANYKDGIYEIFWKQETDNVFVEKLEKKMQIDFELARFIYIMNKHISS